VTQQRLDASAGALLRRKVQRRPAARIGRVRLSVPRRKEGEEDDIEEEDTVWLG